MGGEGVGGLAESQAEVGVPALNSAVLSGPRLTSTSIIQNTDNAKEAAWIALHAHEWDLLEDTMYRRLQHLWSEFSDATTVFDT